MGARFRFRSSQHDSKVRPVLPLGITDQFCGYLWIMSALRRSAASVGAGYLLGTLPSARLATRLLSPRGPSITQRGSGNPGAANVKDELGKKVGAAVMAADVGKAVAASAVGRSLVGVAGGHVAGTAAVVGHCYPIWSGFRNGGKGVATSMGQMLATFPAYAPVDVGLATIMAKSSFWRDRQTESTAVACALWVGLGALWWRRDLPNLWGGRPSAGMPVAAAISSAVILKRFKDEEVVGDSP